MELNKSKLLTRFLKAQATVDSVSSLSHYCTSYAANDVVVVWFDALRKCDPPVVKPLFFIANDIIQRTRAKSQAYVAEFAKVLEKAAEVAAAKAPDNAKEIVRTCNIWKDRQVYSAHFMDGVIAAAQKAGVASLESSPEVSSPRPKQQDAPQPTHNVPATPVADSGGDDAVMERIMSGSLQEALNEAQRRHRVSLAIMQLLSTIKPPYKDGTLATDDMDEDEAHEALDEIANAEKHARFALAIARMNARRRPAIIAKVSEAIALESEKLSVTGETRVAQEEVLQKLEALVAAAAEGKHIRVPADSALGLDQFITAPIASGKQSGAEGVDAAAGDVDEFEAMLMADDWQGDDGYGESMQAYNPDVDAPAVVTTVAGRKRPRDSNDDASDYSRAPHGYAPYSTDFQHTGYTHGVQTSSQVKAPMPTTTTAMSYRARVNKPLPVDVLDFGADEGEGASSPPSNDASAPAVGDGNNGAPVSDAAAAETAELNLSDVLGNRVWNPATQAYELPERLAATEDSWREH